MTEKRSLPVRLFSALFRGLELAARLALSLMVLVTVVMLATLLLPRGKPKVEKTTALVVAPSGILVEQRYGLPAEQIFLELLGQEQAAETLMKPMLDAIEKAADDDRVKVLVLDLNRLAAGGLSKLQDLKRAVDHFKKDGKTVVATSDFYLMPHYYLASLADEVFVHPMGLVVLPGYGSYRRYYKDALDRLEADWNVFVIGEYKSAVEPYTRNDMSEEAREARREWLGDLWQAYRGDVAAGRGLPPEAIEAYAAEFAAKLAGHGGDAARLALAEGLVDRVANRDEVRDHLIELVGEDGDTGSYRQIDYRTYLRAVGPPAREGDNVVAVVVAKGTILDGTQPPGEIGGDSTAALIREAREDEDVKAIVLRVDSPGGSAFAAEIIRREIELAKRDGKPVVASMGSVAASGGYWISMSANKIFASPTTITGSIGIYAMIPTFERTLAKVGVHSDGVGTHPLAGTLRPDRSLPPEAAQALQLMMEQGYREFITKAAEGRGKPVEEIERIARGRVWSGEDGLRLGLVDAFGGLDDAVAAAAELAELGEDWRVVYFEQQPSTWEFVASQFLSRVGARFGGAVARLLPDRARALSWLGDAEPTDWGLLAPPGRPPRALAYCFCGE